MLKLVASRLLRVGPTVLGIVLVALLLVELMPGDPAAIMAGEDAPPQVVEVIRKDLNLDKPLLERFGSYVWGLLQGDFGQSPPAGIAVRDRIEAALPVTVSLSLWAMAMAVALSVPAGIGAALWRDRLFDRAVTAVSSLIMAVPAFVLGLVLVILFAVDRSWFPAAGYVPFGEDPWQWFRHLALPAFALSLPSAAELARQTRGAMVDTLEQDYIRACRAKGLGEFWIVGKHAAKNAAIPVVTVAGLQASRVLGGTVVVEQIFALNGFGSLAVNAVFTRDLVLLQGVVIISALVVLTSNLLVDLSYGYLNPRVKT